MYCYCPMYHPFISNTQDYPHAVWNPANANGYQNANRPKDFPITGIVIHTMQGTYDGSSDWFKDPKAHVSAHYLIGSDGRIEQMVQEKNIAYHAGNHEYNQHTIGIEHEGWVDQPKWYTSPLYDSSTRVTAYLAKKYNIPIDRKHIFGHREIPGQEHRRTDPGDNWNWDSYMDLVKKYSNGNKKK